MATCGNCQESGQTVEHIRECHQKYFQLLQTEPVSLSGFSRAFIDADFRPVKVPDSLGGYDDFF